VFNQFLINQINSFIKSILDQLLLCLIRQPSHGQDGDPVGHCGRVEVAELEDRVLHQAEREHVLVAGVVQLKQF
jgi:hypothetical protein